jgi:hypothetical protein
VSFDVRPGESDLMALTNHTCAFKDDFVSDWSSCGRGGAHLPCLDPYNIQPSMRVQPLAFQETPAANACDSPRLVAHTAR